MTRLNLLIFVIIFTCPFVGVVHAQGATIKGEVIDISPEQRPIEGATVKIVNAATEEEFTVKTNKTGFYEKKGLPAGRYMISVSKNGYGDRIGKPKAVAAGGEIFDRIKMKKQENIFTIFTLFQRQPLVWLLVAGVTFVIIVALVIFFIDSRKPRY